MNKMERQRYILFKIIQVPHSKLVAFNKKEFLNILWNIIWDYFGMNTASRIGLYLHSLNENFGIIRCSHKTKEIMISALTLLKKIDNQRIIVSPVKTSGILRKVLNAADNLN
ncbi:MAG: Ribonuclease P protein component 2 [Promethearchaeota archaeon]|nr:MAG: Ribonuclease P protein component 2 [Candidatus Lokiarchaeota archaeon]